MLANIWAEVTIYTIYNNLFFLNCHSKSEITVNLCLGENVHSSETWTILCRPTEGQRSNENKANGTLCKGHFGWFSQLQRFLSVLRLGFREWGSRMHRVNECPHSYRNTSSGKLLLASSDHQWHWPTTLDSIILPQPKLIGMTLILQVFGHKPKYKVSNC